jgi:hypothetical protein
VSPFSGNLLLGRTGSAARDATGQSANGDPAQQRCACETDLDAKLTKASVT